jgi:hypothetical protein
VTYRDNARALEQSESVELLRFRPPRWFARWPALTLLGSLVVMTLMKRNGSLEGSWALWLSLFAAVSLLLTLANAATRTVKLVRERGVRAVVIERRLLFFSLAKKIPTEEDPVLVFDRAESTLLALVLKKVPDTRLAKVLIPGAGAHVLIRTNDEHVHDKLLEAASGFEEKVAQLKGAEALRVEREREDRRAEGVRVELGAPSSGEGDALPVNPQREDARGRQ